MTSNKILVLRICISLFAVLSFIHVSAQKNLSCLDEYLHVINSSTPDSNYSDLSFLASYVSNKQIVSLGESTHGSKEVFQMKHRVIKYLVEELGFTVFAIEANKIECDMVNKYIQTGKGDPKKLLSQLGYWVWDTQEVLDLIQWMKTYNETHDKPIVFTGFDMQSYAYPLYQINKSTPKNNLKINSALQIINAADSDIRDNQAKGIYQVSDSIREVMYESSKLLYEELKKEQTTSSEVLKKNSDLLFQYATFYSGHKPAHGYRDSCMAQNLKWIMDQNASAKIMVWAHNGHVKRSEFTMGRYLQDLGMRPYVIGFSTHSGEYTAIANGEIVDNVLQLPNESCFEYYLSQPEIPYYYVDLQSLKKQCNFWKKPLKFREIGSMRREEQFYKSDVVEEYDALIHIQRTSGSDCFYKKR